MTKTFNDSQSITAFSAQDFKAVSLAFNWEADMLIADHLLARNYTLDSLVTTVKLLHYFSYDDFNASHLKAVFQFIASLPQFNASQLTDSAFQASVDELLTWSRLADKLSDYVLPF